MQPTKISDALVQLECCHRSNHRKNSGAVGEARFHHWMAPRSVVRALSFFLGLGSCQTSICLCWVTFTSRPWSGSLPIQDFRASQLWTVRNKQNFQIQSSAEGVQFEAQIDTPDVLTVFFWRQQTFSQHSQDCSVTDLLDKCTLTHKQTCSPNCIHKEGSATRAWCPSAYVSCMRAPL